SEFVPWSQAMVATKSVSLICEQSVGKFCLEEMENLSKEVKNAAQAIIEAKNATYYGIGMSLVRIARAILNNENSVLTVTARLWGQYGQRDVFIGVPCIVNKGGIDRVLELSLTEQETAQFAESCSVLRESFEGLQ
ncbi:MAG: L-lactate dehydrogenase, partial [Oscillospiraceae bacterium]